MRIPLLCCALFLFSAPAVAIHKCVANGSTVYSDTPCQDGKPSKELRVATPTIDSAAAQQKLQQEKQQLQSLQQQRAKAEAQDERQQEKRFKAAQAKKKKCAESAQRVIWADEDAYSAQGKTAERAKLKARRALEKHQLACN